LPIGFGINSCKKSISDQNIIMDAAKIIDEIKLLPADEQVKVIE